MHACHQVTIKSALNTKAGCWWIPWCIYTALNRAIYKRTLQNSYLLLMNTYSIHLRNSTRSGYGSGANEINNLKWVWIRKEAWCVYLTNLDSDSPTDNLLSVYSGIESLHICIVLVSVIMNNPEMLENIKEQNFCCSWSAA